MPVVPFEGFWDVFSRSSMISFLSWQLSWEQKSIPDSKSLAYKLIKTI